MSTQTKVPSRRYAGVFDPPVEGDPQKHGVGPGDDYIGGYAGIGWYEYFKDAATGEIYKVRCSDGVNGGKTAYTDEDEDWRLDCYQAIFNHCQEEAGWNPPQITISRNERAIMQSFTHARWLETTNGAGDGVQSNDGLDGGFVGHCLGVPIVCDVEQEDNLPPRA